MILIQLLLVIGFVLVALLVPLEAGSMQVKAWKRLAIIGLFVFSIFSVLVPSIDGLGWRGWVGVYSGANLLLYVLAVSFVAFVLNQYVHNADAHERVVMLTRKLAAILEAQNKKLASQIRGETSEK